MTKAIVVHAAPAALGRPSAAPPLDRNPAAVYLMSLGSAESRRTMMDALCVAAETLGGGAPGADRAARERAALDYPWHLLRYPHVQALRTVFEARYAPASTNKMLTAVKQVVNECRRLGLMSVEDALAVRDVKRSRGSRAGKGRALARGEIAALRAAAGAAAPEIAARDRFLLDLLLYQGLRRDEAATLDLAHVEADALRVLGKGNKQRLVPLGAPMRASLAAWLAVRGADPGPLLYKATKEGRLLRGRALTGATIFARIRRLARAAGVATLGPHDCRRTFATTLLARGVPIRTVANLMGHEDIATTQKYDMSGVDAARAAVEKLDY